jgi:hypothetical protein
MAHGGDDYSVNAGEQHGGYFFAAAASG